MQVVFYNNSSGNEHVTKSLTEVKTFNVDLKDSCSVQNPVLLLSGKYLNANYAQIPDFGNRYYYIDNIVQIRKNLWQYSLRCDVLMSFAEQIKANQATLKRTAKDEFANLYLPDDKRMVTSETFVRCIEFPNGAFSGFYNSNGNLNFSVCIAGIGLEE